jgi:hypothetical protein
MSIEKIKMKLTPTIKERKESKRKGKERKEPLYSNATNVKTAHPPYPMGRINAQNRLVGKNLTIDRNYRGIMAKTTGRILQRAHSRDDFNIKSNEQAHQTPNAMQGNPPRQFQCYFYRRNTVFQRYIWNIDFGALTSFPQLSTRHFEKGLEALCDIFLAFDKDLFLAHSPQ